MRPTALGELLELLDGALSRVVTVEAEYRDWARPAQSLSLVLESPFDGDEAGATRLRWRGGGPFPRPAQRVRRIWFAAPSRLKVEISRGGDVERVGIRDGSRWWRWTTAAGTDSGDAALVDVSRSVPPLLDPPLLTPARLLGWLRFGDDLRVGSRAGREVVIASARLRNRSAGTFPDVRYDLEFDAEHGTMLRMATYDAARRVQLNEATEITYGRELEPSLFVWPPAGMSDAAGAGDMTKGP